MHTAKYRAGVRVDFTGISTPAEFRRYLALLTRNRGGTPVFPWAAAPVLLQLLQHPAPSFLYLQVTEYLRALAAHRILNPDNGCDDLVDLLPLYRPQFVAILAEHVRYHVADALTKRREAEWPECLGRSRLGFGPTDVTPEEIDANRAALLEVINLASLWYERTLGLIACSDGNPESICHHDLAHWISGAGMPGDVLVPVEMAWKDGHCIIRPALAEKRELIRAGWTPPRYVVDERRLIVTPEPPRQEPPAPPLPKPVPTAWAATGETHAIAQGYASVVELKTGRIIPVDNASMRIALEVLVRWALGRENARPQAFLRDKIEGLRKRRRMRPTPTYSLVHHFQQKQSGRRLTSPLYDLLIRNVARQGLYWIAL